MTIDTTNFDQHSTTDLGSVVEAFTHYDVVPVVRLVAGKNAWAIYSNGAVVLADAEGQQLFESSAKAGDFLRACGVTAYFVDGR